MTGPRASRLSFAAAALFVAAAACSGSDEGPADATFLDAQPALDAGITPRDAGPPPDSGPYDAGPVICAGGVCSGPCCEAHESAGCEDLVVTQCVCDVMADCCRVWTEACVEVAVNFQCTTCDLPGPECGNGLCEGEGNETCLSCPIDCGGCMGPCCEANDSPGCEDPTITACVCELESICCTAPWDAQCVSAIERRGCGTCD